MLTIKHNFIKISLFLGLALMLACGRTIIDETPPSFTLPVLTSINSIANSRVKIEWYFDTYQEPLIRGFRLERSENNAPFQVVSDDISPNQRSIELAETSRNSKVSFRLWSKTIKDTISSKVVSYFAPAVSPNAFCVSASVTLLQGLNNKPSVYLSWKLEPNIPTYTGNYIIERLANQAPSQVLATTRNNYFLDMNTEVGVNYTYLVRLATNNCTSDKIKITPIADAVGLCPQDFKINLLSGKDKKSVLLSWNAELAEFSAFYVLRGTSPTGPFEKLTPTGIRTTVFEDKTELKAKTSYFYKISTQIDSQPPNNCETSVVELKVY